MRIRQIKADYWTDPVTARLSDATSLTYIGLWNLADDAGYLEWDVDTIGALLRPYESPRRRVARINKAGAELVAAGRMKVLECGHAVVPTLPTHQRLSGSSKRVLMHQKKHEARQCPRIPAEIRGTPQLPDTEKEQVGNGRERNGTGKERNGSAGARAVEPRDPRHIPLSWDPDEKQWVHVA